MNMKEYSETNIKKRFCPFCGEWMILEEKYEDHDFDYYFRCECKDFILDQDLRNKISYLQRQLPAKKFGIITKQFVGRVAK